MKSQTAQLINYDCCATRVKSLCGIISVITCERNYFALITTDHEKKCFKLMSEVYTRADLGFTGGVTNLSCEGVPLSMLGHAPHEK